ncbi:MAG: putative GTP-binding protein EngB [Candidatus Moranbacteria bacterium GW2011_GWE1_35_17]|nr:MAG: putative GTP-binding protein EngB [Candidatus Moranbacteria bacterium GW2011_GWE2_35_164]KKP68844.1 MAG: putative GTP-binding protein EngB [Candidatus Moranbacteria bacterium GW2011_GWE1_35_17]KKP82081.1 MAG: putative GTP-binding protein EngB [Candidatus Moranbacteria bacterium GW2011_GWF1_35_5]KKP84393.1 MAG: putative GTP-binding protein EngB [Candidatus Moranbacteria bacterium GW2011_GWF2_35_54]
MNIRNAQFVRGIVGTNDIINDTKAQIAFVGRSNVGKSTLLNSLVGNKSLARSSSTPGRTQQINFFLIDQKVYFVDLPGYGYAKTPGKQREKIRKMIIWYLTYSEIKHKKVVLIVDAKAGIQDFDLEMVDLLKAEEIDFIVILNKIDKLKQGEVVKVIRETEEKISDDRIKIITYSSKSQINRDKIIGELFN